jgi:hypothetical protein
MVAKAAAWRYSRRQLEVVKALKGERTGGSEYEG